MPHMHDTVQRRRFTAELSAGRVMLLYAQRIALSCAIVHSAGSGSSER